MLAGKEDGTPVLCGEHYMITRAVDTPHYVSPPSIHSTIRTLTKQLFCGIIDVTTQGGEDMTGTKTTMHGVRVRIYPNEEQKAFIEQSIGNARYVWNAYLGMMTERYRNNPSLPFLSANKLKKLLPPMKIGNDFLKSSDASSLQYTAESLHDAYIAFFKKKRGFPRFKSKKAAKPSYTSKFSHNNIVLTDTHIKLPKLGIVRASWSDDIEFDRIIKATITRQPSGHYTVSVLVERERQVLAPTGQSVGLDMGQIDLMIGSDGYRMPTRQYRELEQKLSVWQKKMSRRGRLAKARGVNLSDAKNYQNAKRMVAKYHAKIRNSRLDYLHKATYNLVKKYDIIAVEDLKVKTMMRRSAPCMPNWNANHRKIANQSWALIREMLAYKCEWNDKTFIKVDPRYTSQDCSSCGDRTGPRGNTAVRDWTCSSCHVHHDRDINAAQNILRRAVATHKTPLGV